jgi:hypothetical protein
MLYVNMATDMTIWHHKFLRVFVPKLEDICSTAHACANLSTLQLHCVAKHTGYLYVQEGIKFRLVLANCRVLAPTATCWQIHSDPF